MAIYTKRGDKGKTSLFDKKNMQRVRIPKDSPVVHVLGTIDELNSFLGASLCYSNDENVKKLLTNVQKDLLVIGSIIAGSKLRFPITKTKKLEKTIDKLEGKLPALKNFLLPGGSKLSSHLHLARSVSRRLERNMVSLSKKTEIMPQILVYLNRLSDLLFMLAREANYKSNNKESYWKGGK